jgi:hypothetical protein
MVRAVSRGRSGSPVPRCLPARGRATSRSALRRTAGASGKLGVELKKPLPEEVLGPVRRLLTDPDPQVVSAALVTAARLDDFDAIPSMIECLRATHAGVRSNALWALRKLTDLKLGERPAAWTDWFTLETQWWEIESARAFARLSNGTKAEKVARCRRSRGCTPGATRSRRARQMALGRFRSGHGHAGRARARSPGVAGGHSRADRRAIEPETRASRAPPGTPSRRSRKQSLPPEPGPWRELVAKAN